MKKAIYIALFLYTSLAFTQNQDIFEQGKNHYNEANYEAAIQSWETILESGQHSAAVYFNLGNAYFKSNQLAFSIYYYEKALQLAPSDTDIQNNIAIAKSQTVDSIEPLPKNLISTWFENTARALKFDVWAWITIALAFGLSLAFLMYFFSKSTFKKRVFFTGFLLLVGFCILSFFITHYSYQNTTQERLGIVFAESTQVKTEPLERGEVSFVLHEGTKLKIINDEQDWVRIQLVDGKDGWMLKSDLKEL